MSLFRLGAGVASSVFFCNFWHLAQTIFPVGWRGDASMDSANQNDIQADK